jgi:hypothetical protein
LAHISFEVISMPRKNCICYPSKLNFVLGKSKNFIT